MQIYILLLLLLRILLCTLYNTGITLHLVLSPSVFNRTFFVQIGLMYHPWLSQQNEPLSVHTSLHTFNPILHRWCILVHNRQRISRIISTIVNIAQTDLTAWKCERQLTNCGFCSNRILHYFPMSVCQSVCHRRDISSFLDNLTV